MGADSRRKGATFERSVVAQINEWLESQDINFNCKRNLDQYQQKDLADIDIPYHAVECKHYADGWTYKPEWLAQVREAAGDKIPVLIYKYNRKPIQVCLPMYAVNTEWPATNDFVCIMTMEDWFEVMNRNWHHYERMESNG
jgi:hypothetical protein|tara:strand:+ start:50 stop:472 length:423 start_codon:yes stop_codon:yes gene_type:complete